MRHNGWQLPCHPLQVCAIAVSLALVFALYIFFLPFVDSTVMRMFIIAVYSPMATTIFLLYIWCVASDPADLQVRSLKRYGFQSKCSKGIRNQNKENNCADPSDNTASICLCMHSNKTDMELHLSEGELIFCSLCCVEVSKNSKHCGTCDKCVEGFDHHCVWLNNCIGKRNYKAFFLLIVLGLFMFILQSSLGLWIIIKSFINRGHFMGIIASKLGKSFSFKVYVFVVVLCTILPMLATYFLGLLTCFHLILIKKGVTTYEYIIASTINRELLDKENLQIQPNSIIKDQAEHKVNHDKIATDRQIVKQTSDSAASWTREHSVPKKKLSVKISPCILASMSKHDIEMALNKSDASSTMLAVQSSRNSNVDVGSSSFGSKYVSVDSVVSMGLRSGSSNRFDANLDFLDQAIASGWSVGKLSLDSSGQLDSSENSGNITRDKALSPLQREAREVFRRSHAFSDFGLIPGFKTC